MKIVVLCNGEFAIPSIDLLTEKKQLVGVAVPVVVDAFPFRMRQLCSSNYIPFLMVRSRPNEALELWLRELAPDVVFVMLFPYRISPRVLSIPKFGFLNWHPGLLPQYRGPEPIFWEIKNQERYGGVTVHKMDQNFDSGPIAAFERVEILPNDTYTSHAANLSSAAKKLTKVMLKKVVRGLTDDALVPQDESMDAYQGAPADADRTISWVTQNSDSILALIRASDIYGGALTSFRGSNVWIKEASAATERCMEQPGTIFRTDPLSVCCSNGSIVVESIYSHDRALSGSEFVALLDVSLGNRFGV